jgi:hypothetical protein
MAAVGKAEGFTLSTTVLVRLPVGATEWLFATGLAIIAGRGVSTVCMGEIVGAKAVWG